MDTLTKRGDGNMAKLNLRPTPQQLRILRKYLKYSRESMASKMGISLSSLTKYETGERRIQPYTMAAFRKNTGMRNEDIFDIFEKGRKERQKKSLKQPEETERGKKSLVLQPGG